MKKLLLLTALAGLFGTVPAEAVRTGRPPVVVTTTSTTTPSVSPF
jgi:hypothetical protein